VTSPVDGQDFPLPLLKADTYEGGCHGEGNIHGSCDARHRME
jgi:hypothetical protein